mgnify:CR=1 FL=1
MAGKMPAVAGPEGLLDGKALAAAGGTGLAAGGSANPAAPVAGYVDYLDQNGNLLPTAAGVPATWFYKRVWAVTNVSATLKRISVTATVKLPLGRKQPPMKAAVSRPPVSGSVMLPALTVVSTSRARSGRSVMIDGAAWIVTARNPAR